ncbi:hypothetical protein RAC89_18065 [Paenibacillus sp. GD4]|uniref:hypothetical protein n=1 Tax=Paenibacillus sp. GD4 TaxID=3068890 RepID=UPI0027968DA9|nr:hypothetical protein [Paenibacillus sp. GD4]MDQ1912298.1 hypothetical protein [Paenibacillus sp. GD4]
MVSTRIPRSRKIIFAILAHENELALTHQIINLRFYHPDAEIVLYNGGVNKRFGQKLGIPVCPYSKPLKYDFLGMFLVDVAKWLHETNTEYEYLVSLDHDILFIKHGFHSFLDETMEGFDCMGWGLTISRNPSEYGKVSKKGITRMWREWRRWQPLFGTDKVIWYFNPGQVYRKSMVTKILARIQKFPLEELLSSTQVTAAEEMLFVTTAHACGARIRSYPDEELGVVRVGPNSIKLPEVKNARRHPCHYWIHPIKNNRLIEMNQYLLFNQKPSGDSLKKQKQSKKK